MRRCPTCHEFGIYEHSVRISLDEVRAALEADADASATTNYSQCARCEGFFRREGLDDLVPLPPDSVEARGQLMTIVPPWKRGSTEGSFEASWDIVEAYYERRASHLEWVRPLQGLVTRMRAAGYGARLRAGQSLNDLGLSRAKEHGLRPGHSWLFLGPRQDGLVDVSGNLGSRVVRFGPVEATLDGPLRSHIEDLARLPLE